MTPPAVINRTPVEVQAAIVREVLAEAHPKLALGNIAHRHRMTMDDLQTLLRHAGYPDRSAMTREVQRLEQRAQADVAVVDEGPDYGDQDAPETSDYPTSARGLSHVSVSALHANPDNVRERLGSYDELQELSESIAEIGLLQPIIARENDGRLTVVAGHRRLAAVRMLGWQRVEVIVRPPMRPDDVVAAMLVENGQRRDLDPIEEARGLLRLQVQMAGEHPDGKTPSHGQLAKKIGRTQVHVSGRLALLDLDPAVQEELRAGQITLGAAIAKGRRDSGRVKPGAVGKKSAQHLSPHHELAGRAQARCRAAGHKAKGSASVGGIACGKCWESVIRADERRSLQERSASTGSCVLCDVPLTSEGA